MTLAPFERYRPNLPGAERDLEPLQDRIEQFTDVLVAQPHLDGSLIEDIAITTGQNDIEHKLGRTIRGWFVARDECPQSSFHVYRTTNQTSVSPGDQIEFDTEEYDYGSGFDIDTDYDYTAPRSGLYCFNSCVSIASVGDGEATYIALRVNASDKKDGSRTESGDTGESVRAIGTTVYLTKDDTVKIIVYMGVSHTIRGGADNTWFNGRLLTGLTEGSSPDEDSFLRLESDCDRTLSVVVF